MVQTTSVRYNENSLEPRKKTASILKNSDVIMYLDRSLKSSGRATLMVPVLHVPTSATL